MTDRDKTMQIFPNKLWSSYAAMVTLFVFIFIGILSLIRLNLHFLDPVSHGVKDYDITDIVYSRFGTRNAAIDERIVIINTDLPDRAVLTSMLQRIIAAQPKVVGMDVFLSSSNKNPVDSTLQHILKTHDNIVIASKLYHYREDVNLFEKETAVDTFFSNYTSTGFANFPSTNTKTIRFFTPFEQTRNGTAYSLATSIANKYDPLATQRLLERKRPLERIHYTATEDNFIRFEPEQILDTSFQLESILAGKIVLIGYINSKNDACAIWDKYYTPFNKQYSGRSEQDMYGVVIHANILRMILNNRYIFTIAPWASFLFAILLCYFNVLLLEQIHEQHPRWYHPIMRILQVLEFLVLFFVISFLFYAFRIKWDFTVGMLALALYFDIMLSYESFINSSRPWINRLPKILSNKAAEEE